jgi:hypothetical protein
MYFGDLVYLSVHSSHDSISGTSIIDTNIIRVHCVWKVAVHVGCSMLQHGSYTVFVSIKVAVDVCCC